MELWRIMETFFSFLEKRVDDCSSLLCVGLDPHIPDLKEPTAASALDFCLDLVKQTAPYAAAFKPNAAFFEVFGAEGWKLFADVADCYQGMLTRPGMFEMYRRAQIAIAPADWESTYTPMIKLRTLGEIGDEESLLGEVDLVLGCIGSPYRSCRR